MDNINALPDLVIRGVISHLVTEHEWLEDYTKKFKGNFYSVHVSRRWRRLGISLVYKTAFVGLDYSDEWTSNIGLITELNMGHLVKTLSVYSEDEDSNKFSDLVEPLYGILNLAIANETQSSKKSIANMTELVQCLATSFPRVVSLDISMRLAHPLARELTNQLVTTFSDSLGSLNLEVNTPVDLKYFPASLKNLEFSFSRFTRYSVPKIRNPENLRNLELFDVHYNFYWEDLVSVSSEFSNLRSLSIDFVDYFYYREMYSISPNNDERRPPTRRLKLYLPQLMDLSIQKRWGSGYLKFNPVQVPSSLNKVGLEISPEELNEFCDLPIKYIRHISFRMKAYSSDLTDVFYSNTNRLLGEMGNNSGTTTVELYDSGIDRVLDLNVEKVEWYNVTTLEIGCLKPSTLLSLLAKLPRVTSVEIKKFSYGSYESVNFQYDSQVEKIRIIEFGYEWSVDTETEFIADMLKQHNRIKSLLLPKNMVERVKEIIDGSSSTYPHWKQITVSETKRY